ncbi:MAG TPA: class I SAM-dependent methyltransferase [Nitrospiraceae bacterium]|nr:class I SAM-dependent methyltransferase [Nitrospiraceae bacterium]
MLEFLRCPCCKSELRLSPIESHKVDLSPESSARATAERIDRYQLEDVVETGVLECASGCSWYPIVNYVPVLLDFPLPLHRQFSNKYRHLGINALDLPLPPGAPRPGELQIQESFTIEWKGLGEDAHTFIYTIEERERYLRAELDWPNYLLQRMPGAPALRVLNVGAGFGLEPIYIHTATGGIARGAEVVGIDLNLSLLSSGAKISAMPFIHTAIASLFALPFPERSFDLVYSHGVLHHTYSTEAAFRSIERYRKPDGTIYIWVYALEDFFQISWKGRVQWVLETFLRPTFARLPRWLHDIVLYPLAWRNLRVTRRLYGRGPNYTMKNALHSVRDRWTPLYAHRHRFNEVLRWFSELGLKAHPVDPVTVQAVLPVPLAGIGIRGISKSDAISDSEHAPQVDRL